MSLSFAAIVSEAALIRGKARAFARNIHDREDVAQDLFLHAFERAHLYDPTRGLVGALLARMIDRKLAHVLEAQRAQCRDLRRLTPIKRVDAIAAKPSSNIDVQLDIQLAISALPAPERETALALRHYTIAEVARARGVHRSRIRRQVARIRRHFTSRGLHELHAGREAA